jgi:hypothetical protein
VTTTFALGDATPMTTIARLSIAAFLVIVLHVAAIAADAPQLHPLSSAQEIRAARKAEPAGELQLSYLYLDERSGETARTIGFGPGYVYLTVGPTTSLYDFRLRRMIVMDRLTQTFTNESLHGVVMARSMDLDDRADTYLEKMKAAGQSRFFPTGVEDPFWIESDVGMTSPDLPRPQISRVPVASGGMQYRYRNEPVARFTPLDSDATEEELTSLGRFLRYAMPIHPDILDAIVEAKKMPSVISYSWLDGDQRVEGQYRLRGLRRTTADYPLPAEYRPEAQAAKDGPDFVKELVPVMAEAVTGAYGGGPRTPESYRQAIAAGYDAADLGTVLTYIEFISNFGPRVVSCPEPPDPAQRCYTMKEVTDRATTRDPRVRPYITGVFGQGRDPDRVIATWSRMNRDGLSNAYVLDMGAATALAGGSDEDAKRAEKLFAGILKGNAYLAGVYNDIGDHLLRQYDPTTAWLFFDVGRALPGSAATGLLGAVGRLEDRMAADFPEFY